MGCKAAPGTLKIFTEHPPPVLCCLPWPYRRQAGLPQEQCRPQAFRGPCGSWLAGDGLRSSPGTLKFLPSTRRLYCVVCPGPIAGKPGSHRNSADLKLFAVPVGAGLPAMGCEAAPALSSFYRALAACTVLSVLALSPASRAPTGAVQTSSFSRSLWELACRRWAAKQPRHSQVFTEHSAPVLCCLSWPYRRQAGLPQQQCRPQAFRGPCGRFYGFREVF